MAPLGVVGSGSLLITGDASGLQTPMVISGHVGGRPGKFRMKATGIAAFTDGVAEVRLSPKQVPMQALRGR